MLLIVCNRINIKKLADLRNLLSSNNFRIINNATLQLEFQRKNFSIINKQFAALKPGEKKVESAFSSLVHRNQDDVPTQYTGVKKVKQAATDFTYIVIISFGVVMLCVIGYFLFSELFTRETPSGIYDESSKICLDNFQVKEALGHPIKVTAESGGRRVFHVKHKYYLEDNQLCLSLNYYLEGPKNKGTVICKLRKNETSGKLEYDHIVVKLEYPHRGENRILVKSIEQDSKNDRF